MDERQQSQESGISRSPRDKRPRSRSLSRTRSKRKRSPNGSRHGHGHRSKRRRSRSPAKTSYHKHHKHSIGKRAHKERTERDYKIDEIFNWVQSSRQSRRRRSHSSYSRSSSRSRERSGYSRPSHDISFDSRSMKSVVIPVSATQTTSNEKETAPQGEVDQLTARLNELRAEGLPKPVTSSPISDQLAPVLGGFLVKSEFLKTMKICDKYPRPMNIEQLSIPELPKDANRIIDPKAVNNDNRLVNDQKCTSAIFGALSKSLDVVIKLKDKVPEMIDVGDMLLDSLQMTGFLHQDFTSIRLKGFKQNVNPSYVDVVSQKPEEPGMLLGKTPIGEQMKSCDENNKLKAKFKKPDHTQSTQPAGRKDFRKGGEYKRRQNNREFRPRKPHGRDDRRTRYYSPKGNYRKNQQDVQKQDEKKSQNFRKN